MRNSEATILIVDDEPINLSVLSATLANEYLVRAANSGVRCIEVANSDPRPDLILLDIQMPEMDGYEVLTTLKQNPATQNIPVIFVTASNSIENEEKGLKLGAVDFILKPIRPAILHARIKTQLLIKQAENLLRNKNSSLEHEVVESEQLFQHIIEVVPVAIYKTSLPDFKLYFFCSDKQKKPCIDYQSFNNSQQNWYEHIHPEDQQPIKELIKIAVHDQKPNFRHEYRFLHGDNSTVTWLEDNGTIEYSASGEAFRIFGSITDISKRKESEQKLQGSFEATIMAVSKALGQRDPYTASHQYNCARIAKAIAQQLNLNDEMVNGIYQAAAIHDIGKIYLPSEILNKPSSLSYAEFGLVKTHAQVGYDIIKDVKFPWPIATAIVQHHERLDGSGYPKGLKEGEICLEAKILSIADVVDAISSDRPYRKGLGLDAALTEIESNAGKLYDAEAVNACLILFREHNFPIYND